ncbi:unnamed protein product [Mytilus coruscus]|uniref:Ubiquitin-like protease family profile domain-containing protein n=1 Tax=Mytilus coruscus TaxID=42192 RepID=A0A6J8AQZ3_MYTCO|nr:unnamed protein product [Mytilus coruscus]
MDLSDNSGWIQLDECRGYASNIHQAEEVRKTFEVSKRLFISERHNRGIRRNPSFSLEWSIVTRKHRKQLDSSACGVFTLKFAEHVLTDNDFMFDSSKRAIRASRHIIGQILCDNSVKGLSKQQQPKAMPPRPKLRKPKLKTCLQCQSLTSAMCDDFDTMPMTITRGFSSVKGQNLATLFDVHVKHKLKEVIEMTELQGNARQAKELYALVLAEFSEWKIKSIQ